MLENPDPSQRPAPEFEDWIMPNLDGRAGFKKAGPDGPRPRTAAGPGQSGSAAGRSVDVVVCVHNALEYVRRCVASVLPTLHAGCHLIIVDDDSDSETQSYLQSVLGEHPDQVSLLHSSQRLYYTRAANLGLQKSDSDLTILLNSDTVVPSRWLVKLVNLAFLKPAIGIVGPLSNAAHLQSIPSVEFSAGNSAINALPPDMTLESIDALVEQWSMELDIPLVPYVHGFCLAIKKEVRSRVGLFDGQTFPRGYGDENDYCFRAADQGFRMAVCTSTYVFHAKSRSYAEHDRVQLMQQSFQALVRKHPGRIEPADWILRHHPILQAMRAKARDLYSDADGV